MSNKTEEPKCIHRHTIKTHPACFARGMVKVKPVKVIKEKEPKIPWYQEPGTRIGYLDIEADGLKPDFATMLSWCIKEKEGAVTYARITKEDLFNETYDKNLVEALLNEMKKYNIIVTYFGTNYDIPFIRAKAMHYDLEFPSYADFYHFDLYYTVKSKILLSSRRLESVCDYLHIVGKTPLDREVWRKAKYGNEEALNKVVEHNIGDVMILEQLHDRLEPFAKWTKRSG